MEDGERDGEGKKERKKNGERNKEPREAGHAAGLIPAIVLWADQARLPTSSTSLAGFLEITQNLMSASQRVLKT